MTRAQFVRQMNRKPQYRDLADFGMGFEQVDAAREAFAAARIGGPSYCRGEWVMCKTFATGTPGTAGSITLRMGAARFAEALRDVPALIRDIESNAVVA